MLIDGLKSVPRRTALMLVLGGAVSVVAALLLINSGSSRAGTGSQRAHQSGRGGPVPVRRRGATDKLPPTAEVEKLVGQRFMVGLRGVTVQSALLEDARTGMIGGVLLFPEGANEAETSQAVGRLQAATKQGGNPPLLIATDQEGGPVKRFPQGPPTSRLSDVPGPQALVEGEKTGSFLQGMHINTDLAPVVDLGLPDSSIAQEDRTISANPRKVSEIGSAFMAGLQQTSTLAVAKHFPGLGSATVNTDLQRTEVAVDVGQSLLPFRELVRGGVKGVMVSTAAYRTLDPGHGAAWSRKIVTDLLRRKLGFNGIIFSDDLSTDGVHEWMSTPAATKAALQAGVDVVIIGEPNSFRPAFRVAVKAAEHGDLEPRQLEASFRRIKAEKEWMK